MKEILKSLLYAMKLMLFKNKNLEVLNVTKKPTNFPYEHYLSAKNIQKTMNLLIFKMMHDEHQEISDPLYLLLNDIRKIKPSKNFDGLFIRVDYLLDQNIMKQVEINTISCAFVFQGPILNKIHSLYNINTLISNSDQEFIEFVKAIKTSDSNLAVMIDNDITINSSNFFEKMEIIYKLKENGINMVHLTMEDVENDCIFYYKNNVITNDEIKKYLNNKNRLDIPLEMYYKDQKVFFVYYRWFYNFDQYCEETKITRTKIECSSAVSLPSVELQIVGLKTFQIKMKDPEYLTKFLFRNEINEIQKHFGDFKKISEVDVKDIDDYILKNLNEGGGHNIFGKDILKYKGDTESVFLMKKFTSRTFDNYFINDSDVRKVIPEIGIFGWLLSKDGEIIFNNEAGYICRSKDQNSNECGVSCGFGALDSILKK